MPSGVSPRGAARARDAASGGLSGGYPRSGTATHAKRLGRGAQGCAALGTVGAAAAGLGRKRGATARGRPRPLVFSSGKPLGSPYRALKE